MAVAVDVAETNTMREPLPELVREAEVGAVPHAPGPALRRARRGRAVKAAVDLQRVEIIAQVTQGIELRSGPLGISRFGASQELATL